MVVGARQNFHFFQTENLVSKSTWFHKVLVVFKPEL